MESEVIMQAVFDFEKITVSVRMFGGDVFVTRTFEGTDVYGRFLDFLKEQFGKGNAVHALTAVQDSGSG